MKLFTRSRTSAEATVAPTKAGSGMFRKGRWGAKREVEEKRVDERKDEEEPAPKDPEALMDEREPAEGGLKTPNSEMTAEGIEKQMDVVLQKPKRMNIFRKAREMRLKKVEDSNSRKFQKAANALAPIVEQETAAKEEDKAADVTMEEPAGKNEDVLKEEDAVKEDKQDAVAMADVPLASRSNDERIDAQPSPMDGARDEAANDVDDENDTGSLKSMDSEFQHMDERDLSEEPHSRTGLFCGCI